MKASNILGVNYSSAKTIMRTYKEKGRIYKKLTRDRGKGRKARGNLGTDNLALYINKTLGSRCNMLQPIFDFSVYREPIATLFTVMCRKYLKMMEEMSNKITLPLPNNFYLHKSGIGDKGGRTSGSYSSTKFEWRQSKKLLILL